MFGWIKKELKIVKKLRNPAQIQDFLDTLAVNFEKKGDTHLSPRLVLERRKAHCFEGALLAAAILWTHGQKPLLLDLKSALRDDDHVVALYRVNGYWGAISKTNHTALRFRDPVYRTVRELALSYFHEYFDNETGKKVLRSYSRPFDLRRFGREWITNSENLKPMADALDFSPHYNLLPKKNARFIRKADRMERKAGLLTEWKKSDHRT